MKYNFVRFKEIDSTNNEAKRYVSAGGELPALLLSETQKEGRGRMGRSFYSDNKGVYITVVVKAPGENLFLRGTAVSAVCVVESIKELFGISTEIRWVNDIYYQSKKVAGILAESFVFDVDELLLLRIDITCLYLFGASISRNHFTIKQTIIIITVSHHFVVVAFAFIFRAFGKNNC